MNRNPRGPAGDLKRAINGPCAAETCARLSRASDGRSGRAPAIRKLLRSLPCGTVAAMAIPKSTDAASRPQAPEWVGSTSVNEPLGPPRVTLPRNLSTTLQGLQDIELETLQQAVSAEVKRRGMNKPAVEVPEPQAVVPAKASEAKIPAGKANLIRASFQTGMTPSAIARLLRVSRSIVEEVLGTQAKPKQ